MVLPAVRPALTASRALLLRGGSAAAATAAAADPLFASSQEFALLGNNLVKQLLVGLLSLGSVLMLSWLGGVLYYIYHDSVSTRGRGWSQMKDQLLFLASAPETTADGAAAEHTCAARQEAARRLIM